jgi:hypothetical protein
MEKELIMKSYAAIASFFVLSSLAVPAAMAAPSSVEINLTCPALTGSGALYNFGSYIGGYGSETINGNPSSPSVPFFVGEIASGANIPSDLTTGSYANDSTAFAVAGGVISCNYVSSASPAFDPITVTYTLTNANFITLVNQTNNSITLAQYMGLGS